METRYKETNLLWPHFTKHEMKFNQVLSYKISRWGHVCYLGVKWRRLIHDAYKPRMPPCCTQGTHMPSSGSFVTVYLAELHFGNGYMEVGLLISSLHALDIKWPSLSDVKSHCLLYEFSKRKLKFCLRFAQNYPLAVNFRMRI